MLEELIGKRSISFTIPGNPPLSITAWEDGEGNIKFDLTASGKSDIRGLFFNINTSLVDGFGSLNILGDDVTGYEFEDSSNFQNGDNVIRNGNEGYDTGVDFGSSGIGRGAINHTSFTLSSDTEPLTLDLISHMEFATRIQSIKWYTKNGGLQKTFTTSPAAPDAIDDHVTTLEDTQITIDAIGNDTDADNDALTIISVGDAAHGTVSIVDNKVVYMADKNWSSNLLGAPDSFTYTVYDGDGGYDTATAFVDVQAVADAPALTLTTSAGATVNEIDVLVTSSLVDMDGSESYVLTFDGLPEGVTLLGADNNGQITLPTGSDRVTLKLSEGQDFNFDFKVSATSSEVNSTSTAATTAVKNIVLEYNQVSENIDFQALNESMWTTGSEFVFKDDRFLGYDDDNSGHSTGMISTNWSYDVKAGFQSNLTLKGGDVDAQIPWQLDFATSFNKTTDVLTFDTGAMLLGGGFFNTKGPSLTYMLDLIFNYDLSSKVTLYKELGTVWGIEFGKINEILFDTGDPGLNNEYENRIIEYNSDTYGNLSYTFAYPYNDITASLKWPNLVVSGNETGTEGIYEGDGSSNFLTIRGDVDNLISKIYLGGKNPFYYSEDLTLAGGTLTILDVIADAELKFLQTFLLDAGNLDAYLLFEDGITKEDFTFGDTLSFTSASQYDTDKDGLVEVEIVMDLIDTTLYNKTDIGLDAGYTVTVGSGTWWYGKTVLGKTLGDYGSFGPMAEFDNTIPIASIPVFEETIGVYFNPESMNLIA